MLTRTTRLPSVLLRSNVSRSWARHRRPAQGVRFVSGASVDESLPLSGYRVLDMTRVLAGVRLPPCLPKADWGKKLIADNVVAILYANLGGPRVSQSSGVGGTMGERTCSFNKVKVPR